MFSHVSISYFLQFCISYLLILINVLFRLGGDFSHANNFEELSLEIEGYNSKTFCPISRRMRRWIHPAKFKRSKYACAVQ